MLLSVSALPRPGLVGLSGSAIQRASSARPLSEIAYTFLSGRPCWSTVVARTQLLFSITRNVR
ncbi:Uncharacterised protein [Mycobacterium tuberculosis]|nr:Uncharacterised protein [Mycobacterium tuberculosis]CNN11698.1 Uncharacterised protein [Mycobacterium tuberculosis]CNV64240.1 Uncharacterised protein [Mycobacterium tuberculosis]SGC06415.1 Uncharacterised protein [Mycobacterium tuberculosis]SGD75342.1 Uncharacterised protein [Mycobacterium tuberculosis]